MTDPQRSAELIMQLYDLRREEKMREARNWFISYFPEGVEDIMKTMIDEATSAKYRMVTTYWDMAASFVIRGAIDEEMFFDSAGECWVIFSKVEPYIDGVREMLGNANYLRHLETLLKGRPNADETLATRRETMKRWMQARADMANPA